MQIPNAAPGKPRAFTLIELLVVVAIVGVLIGILVPALAGARNYARKAKDSTHVRAIVQGMVAWGGQHDGAFPQPSKLDLSNRTVDPGGEAPLVKDNTGNILSVLIYNGLFEAEQAVSPAELNDMIEEDTAYERDSASMAVAPNLALWDPGFAGIPGELDSFSGLGPEGRRKGSHDSEVGHNSYALAFPFGDREETWEGELSSRMVIAGNRGPQYKFKDPDTEIWSLDDSSRLSGQSNTLRFYGREDSWSGFLVYGDGHADFSDTPTPEGLRVAPEAARDTNTPTFLDNVFVNEDEDPAGRFGQWSANLDTHPARGQNAFLRMWGNLRCDIGTDDVQLPAIGGYPANQGNFID